MTRSDHYRLGVEVRLTLAGGGKGVVVVHSDDELLGALDAALDHAQLDASEIVVRPVRTVTGNFRNGQE